MIQHKSYTCRLLLTFKLGERIIGFVGICAGLLLGGICSSQQTLASSRIGRAPLVYVELFPVLSLQKSMGFGMYVGKRISLGVELTQHDSLGYDIEQKVAGFGLNANYYFRDLDHIPKKSTIMTYLRLALSQNQLQYEKKTDTSQDAVLPENRSLNTASILVGFSLHHLLPPQVTLKDCYFRAAAGVNYYEYRLNISPFPLYNPHRRVTLALDLVFGVRL